LNLLQKARIEDEEANATTSYTTIRD